MARRRSDRREDERPEEGTRPEDEGSSEVIDELIRRAQTTGSTGQMLIAVQRGGGAAALRALRDRAGVAMVSTAEAGEGGLTDEDIGEGGVFLEKLSIAIAPLEVDQRAALRAAGADNGVRFSRPERLIYAIQGETGLPTPLVGPPLTSPVFPWGIQPLPIPPMPVGVPNGLPLEYLVGYRDAIVRLVDGLTGTGTWAYATPAWPGGPATLLAGGPMAAAADRVRVFADTQEATWGLQATKVFDPPFKSAFSGRGVKVAILDTGLDLNHPDFQDGRVVQTKSFVGQPVQDRNGHGTWCVGTACGPLSPQGGRRYGVASGAEICVGKVLQNNGFAIERSLLQGINWAIEQGCRVVSMSLSVQLAGGARDPIYEQAGDLALQNNTALIAAAGNDSRREANPPSVRPVGSPANSTRIMAVGAVDSRMRIAPFSNGAGPGTAGAIDLVGPGVATFGAWSQTAVPQQSNGFKGPGLNEVLQGTSMATPHVAGIAALIAEARPEYDAADLMNALMLIALPLDLSSRDVGKGLVQAPPND